MKPVYNNHNDFLKDWTKSEEAKKAQREVFSFLVRWIDKKDDGKYAEVSRKLPEVKVEGIDREMIIYAINNLVRIGYLFEMQRSRGYNIRISKKGYERYQLIKEEVIA